jgi:5-methylcytosine-specific restriction endonuclease McrA
MTQTADERRAVIRAWNKAHPETMKAAQAKFRATPAGKAMQAKSWKKWYEKNRARHCANSMEYERTHREQIRPRKAASWRRWLDRKLNAEGSHTKQEWLDLCKLFDQRCAYCFDLQPLSEDHVIPLIAGGTDHINNIAPACSWCNASKGQKLLKDWL